MRRLRRRPFNRILIKLHHRDYVFIERAIKDGKPVRGITKHDVSAGDFFLAPLGKSRPVLLGMFCRATSKAAGDFSAVAGLPALVRFRSVARGAQNSDFVCGTVAQWNAEGDVCSIGVDCAHGKLRSRNGNRRRWRWKSVCHMLKCGLEPSGGAVFLIGLWKSTKTLTALLRFRLRSCV